jgi:hypothetical protein
MFLRSRANIDCKFKCAMLQEAARKEAQEKTQPTIKSSSRQHQRRVSFSDEMKKTYLKENSSCNAGSTTGSSGGGSSSNSSSTSSSSASSSSSTTTTATNLQSRYNDNDQLANLLAKK